MNEQLWSPFPAVAKKDWLSAAQKELKGEDPLQKLSHRSGNIRVEPYYDETDLPDTHLFVLEPSVHQWSEPRYWVNAPKVVVQDARDANLISLRHLQGGADGIFFQISNPDVDISQLFGGIELPYCSVFFSGNLTPSFIASFCSFGVKNFKPAEINGAMFHAKPETIASAITEFRGWKNFYAAALTTTRKATPEETLSTILVQYAKALGSGNASEIATHSGVSLNVSHDLFSNIAMLKALRILSQGVQAAFHVSKAPFYVHAVCDAWEKENLGPHSTMLAGTTAAMASVLGGCDALSLLPADPGNEMEVRMARNVSLVLREEARLSLTADPTAGSYYLEALVNQLVNKSWAGFLKTMNR